MERIHLLPSESHLQRVPSISSITFFSSTNSIQSISEYLEQRLHGIVDVNRWLLGHLVLLPTGDIALDYPNAMGQKGLVIEQVNMPNLSPDMSYVELCAAVENFQVEKAILLLQNPSLPLLRLVWITINPTLSALYFSVNHVVADGYTYYRLYDMLDVNGTITSLDPKRIPEFLSLIRESNDTLSLHRSGPMNTHMIHNLTVAKEPTITFHRLSNDWIKKQKAAAAPTKVSSNDIIASWLFQKCKTDIGFIVFNMRRRISCVPSTVAGNYGTVIGYQPQDFAAPQDIRLSIENYHRAHSGNFPELSINTITTMLTSWTSLGQAAIALPGWSHESHFPCTTSTYIPPYTNIAIVFRLTKDELGLVIRSRTIELEGLTQDGAITSPC